MNRFLLCAALGLYGGAALAQQLPNEVDLKAAYCMPVKNATLQQVNNMYVSASNDEDKKTLAKAKSEIEANLTRLNLYLFPRFKYLDQTSIFAAIESGKADVNRWGQDWQACMTNCPMNFQPRDTSKRRDHIFQEAKACREKCTGESQAFERQKVCGDLAFLPF
jgi:hypothetical protein